MRMRRFEVVTLLASLLCISLMSYLLGNDFTIFKDAAQITFWLVASVLALLTYVNARQGILQPIRTEVFKGQLEAIRSVQALFVAKQEVELREDAGMPALVSANARKLLADYAKVYFGKAVETPPRYEKGDGWRPLHGEIRHELDSQKWFDVNAVRLEERERFWSLYRLPGVFSPKSFTDSRQKIREVIENPLLPSKVKSPIEVYLKQLMTT